MEEIELIPNAFIHLNIAQGSFNFLLDLSKCRRRLLRLPGPFEAWTAGLDYNKSVALKSPLFGVCSSFVISHSHGCTVPTSKGQASSVYTDGLQEGDPET